MEISPDHGQGCPTSRSFFARCGSNVFRLELLIGVRSFGVRPLESHISQKTSEIWGTPFLGGVSLRVWRQSYNRESHVVERMEIADGIDT
jgi:hypothetical protein